jgi:acetyl esterase
VPDYSTLIDAETWAFIERTNAWYPPDAIDHTIAEQRRVYDRMCREFFAGYPDGVTAETKKIHTLTHSVPTRTYRAARADASTIVLYLHGGGFVVGGLESHDDVCAELCQRTGYEVRSVDYRLAPEHLHPAAFRDVMIAWHATSFRRQPIVVCGDSAGGNLAAAVSHATRGRPGAPIGQVLIYPGLGGDMSRGSYVEHADAPMLTVRDIEFYRDVRSGGPERQGDATVAPLRDSDFSGLPPTVIITAQCDPLSSDGEAYRDRILAAGGKAWWFEEPGLVHSFLRGRHTIGRARAGFTRIVDAVSALGKRQWPY